jgi:hypothetical protein
MYFLGLVKVLECSNFSGIDRTIGVPEYKKRLSWAFDGKGEIVCHPFIFHDVSRTTIRVNRSPFIFEFSAPFK